MMMQNVAGMPTGDEFVEACVFDAPTVVAEIKNDSRAGQSGGHGGGPIPIGVYRTVHILAGDLFVAGAGFVGVDDA